MTRFLIVLVLLTLPARAADIVASGTSTSAVQTAVDSASNGDTVLIPNGSATWTSGISTSKNIIIRAQNLTATPAGTEGSGATSRNVTITNNSSGPLFAFTATGNTHHCGVGGIRFDEGTGTVNAVHFEGSGSKVPLVFDCYFQTKQRNGSAATVTVCAFLCTGGVMWNCVADGRAFPGSDGVGPSAGSAFVFVESERLWTTASTFGSLDSAGTQNLYIEDSTFQFTGDVDVDDHGRLTARNCVFDGMTLVTHGFTSAFGGRHIEVYDSTFQCTDDDRNHSGRYTWCRAGSFLFTDCTVNNASSPMNYGNISLLSIGDNTSPGGYPMNRQPGGGHNGSAYVIDPIYIWNNSGTRAYTWGYQDDPGGWEGIVQEGRDVFVNAGAKSGYSKYTYPHPMRSVVEGGGGGGGTPEAGPRRVGPRGGRSARR